MNPLLEVKFAIPFDQIRAEHVEPAMDELLARAANSLEAATQAADPLMALDEMTEPLDWALGAVRHLESVATYPELRAAYKDRKSTRLNSSHMSESRMPSSA